MKIGDKVKLNPAGMTAVGKAELHRWMNVTGEVQAIMPRDKYTIGVNFANDDPAWLVWVAERELTLVEAQ